MSDKVVSIRNPLVIMFEDEGKVVCRIHPSKTTSHREYGMLICDLVRHVARAFNVEEDDVWECVDKERRQPTTAITRSS